MRGFSFFLCLGFDWRNYHAPLGEKLKLPRPAEGDPSPYLPELQLSVEGLSNGDDPAKVSVIDCESVEEEWKGVKQNITVRA